MELGYAFGRTAIALLVCLGALPRAHAQEAGDRKPAAPALRAEGAWVRQPAPSRDVTAAYLVLINEGDAPVRVVGGESRLAKDVELHEMVLQGEMMRMRRVKEIVVPARARVELKPGGLHVMLFGLTRQLKAGDSVPLTLTIEGGGTLAVEAAVRAPGTAK